MYQERKCLFNQLRSYPIHILLAGLLVTLSCKQEPDKDAPSASLVRTPREAYLAALDSNGLGSTQMVKAWVLAGEKALADSIVLEAPFQETGYFRAAEPAARTYRMELKAGELLQIALFSRPDSVLFFADFYRIEDTDSTVYYRHLFNAENYQTDSIDFEVKTDGTYLFRIQPELLVTCRYTLRLIVQPAYGVFPVSGKRNEDIWSFFGDPREGGRRTHKGIDIFARRGTPVVAAVDGIVRRVRDEGLGGKQVWLYDEERRQSLYYAHLDRQLVTKDQRVRAGDTLGTVGNTGNAKTTRPHLHFSIYRRGFGAVDPHPFVAYQPKKAPRVNADTVLLGQLARIRRDNTPLQVAPQPKSAALATLGRHQTVQLIAASKYWYRVSNPDGLTGFLPVSSLETIDQTLSTMTLDKATELLQSPDLGAPPVSTVQPEAKIAVIGKNGDFQLVRDENGAIGWISNLSAE